MKKASSLFAAFLLSVSLGGGVDFNNQALAETVISSGSTQTYSATGMSFPITVSSGGTLLHTGNIGTKGQTTDVLTISGTGNGKYSGADYPYGAIASTSSYGMANGIFATVNIDGSASVLSTSRVRFQGNVTGGTLTTYAVVGGNPEVHAGVYSAFNIDKLIVQSGNFTFNGTDGSNPLDSQTHYFKNGITVENGGYLRLWQQKDLQLYTDTGKSQLATITINPGGKFSAENMAAQISANLYIAGDTTIAPVVKLTQKKGNIEIAANKKLSLTSANFVLGDDAGDITLNSGSTLYLTGNRTLNGDLVFNGDATLDLGEGAKLTMSNNDLTAAGKTVTVAAGDGKPATSWTLDSIIANKLKFDNSVSVSANSIQASLDLYNSTGITIADNGELLLGADGIVKHGSGTNTIKMGAGSTLGLTSGTEAATISGTGPINLVINGDIDVDLDAGQTLTIASVVNGTGSLDKTGAGTLVLSGNNTYNGGTTVSQGTLLNSGTLAGDLTVKSGGTLADKGTVTGTVKVQEGGNVNPLGAGTIGNITLSDLSVSQSDLTFDVNSLTDIDTIAIGADVELSDVRVVLNPLSGSSFDGLSQDSSLGLITGLTETQWETADFSLSAPAITGLPDAFWVLGYDASTQTVSAEVGVPEPTTWALLILGVFGIASLRKFGTSTFRRP